MAKFADDGSEQAARKLIEQDRAMVGKGVVVPGGTFADRTKGKPTPTQEENDLAAHGAHFLEHEDDGSGPDPFNTRSMEAKPGGGYETRAVKPTPPAPKPAA